jgi:undecaprenyl-diphosphatase
LSTALLLGLIQGLTEFLPISSSGHLVLVQQFLPVGGDALAFDLLLHLGTLVPVLVVFRADLLEMLRAPFLGAGPIRDRPGVRWIFYVAVASVPTALMGLALEDYFESVFSDLGDLSWQFAVTALALHATARVRPGTLDIMGMRWWHAALIGSAQGIAILPAVSRSGATIVAAMLLGLNRDLAGRFSFVISIPAILGAALLKLREVTVPPGMLPAWSAGTAVALVSGWVSLVFLVRVIRAGDFSKFAGYCWVAAALCGWLALRS